MSDYTYGLLLATRIWLIIIGAIEVEKDANAKKLLGVILDRMKPELEDVNLDSLLV